MKRADPERRINYETAGLVTVVLTTEYSEYTERRPGALKTVQAAVFGRIMGSRMIPVLKRFGLDHADEERGFAARRAREDDGSASRPVRSSILLPHTALAHS